MLTRTLRTAVAAVLLLCLVPAAHAQEISPFSFGGRPYLHAPRVTGALRAQASAASPEFDATFYHLNLNLDFDPDLLSGLVRVVGRVTGGPLQTLVLDFSDGMDVQIVTWLEDGTALRFTHENDALSIQLPRPLTDGEIIDLRVLYSGIPDPTGFGTFAFGRRADGSRYAWTLSEPYGAREWWPSKDHPSDKADSVRVTVTVPEGYRVGSNGLLRREIVLEGQVAYDWVSHYPISTYLVAFSAGRFTTREQTYTRPDSLAAQDGPAQFPILHYYYQGADAVYEGTSETSGWKRVVDVMPLLEYWFGAYPFQEEKYGHMQFTWGGGMEHQTMSSMGGSSLDLVTHELAHQWFGDKVTLRFWPHLWLNEGFATYSELLLFERRFPGALSSEVQAYMSIAREAQGTLVVEDTTSVGTLFDHTRVYFKGSMILHMLRGMVGADVFRQILRAYTEDPAVRYGTAVTADFQRVAEQASGRDLSAFFRQWVTHGTGYPTYALDWSAAPDETGGYLVSVQARQTHDDAQSNVLTFIMPVTLAVQTTAGEERFTVSNDQREQRYTFRVGARPTGITLDPDWLILRDPEVHVTSSSERLDEGDGVSLAPPFPNPAHGTLHVTFTIEQTTAVRLVLYDSAGRRMDLLDTTLGSGPHSYDFDVSALPAGLYHLRLESGGIVRARQVTVLWAPLMVPGPILSRSP